MDVVLALATVILAVATLILALFTYLAVRASRDMVELESLPVVMCSFAASDNLRRQHQVNQQVCPTMSDTQPEEVHFRNVGRGAAINCVFCSCDPYKKHYRRTDIFHLGAEGGTAETAKLSRLQEGEGIPQEIFGAAPEGKRTEVILFSSQIGTKFRLIYLDPSSAPDEWKRSQGWWIFKKSVPSWVTWYDRLVREVNLRAEVAGTIKASQARSSALHRWCRSALHPRRPTGTPLPAKYPERKP